MLAQFPKFFYPHIKIKELRSNVQRYFEVGCEHVKKVLNFIDTYMYTPYIYDVLGFTAISLRLLKFRKGKIFSFLVICNTFLYV